MRSSHLLQLSLLVAVGATAAAPARAQTHAELVRQVFVAESSFAATMAARDGAAFATHVAEEAVFFSQRGPLRGKAAVLEAWHGYFDGPTAPFSWNPEVVEVLASGTLALTSGPVHDATGKLVGTFSSIWRREADGQWRIIFDKGCQVCACANGT